MMSDLSFQSDIYFKAAAAVSGSSDSSSKEMSSTSSPQTPAAHEMPESPLSSLEGNVESRQLKLQSQIIPTALTSCCRWSLGR